MKGLIVAMVLLLSSSISWPVSITYEAPVDGSSVTVPITTSGDYYIYSWGVFVWGSVAGEGMGNYEKNLLITVADPEYMMYANSYEGWAEYWFTHPWFSLDYDCNDLQVNNQFVNWEGLQTDGSYQAHTYSEAHQYRIESYLDNDVSFRVFDTDYHDNLGHLNVKVEPVPEASTIVLFAIGAGLFMLLRRRRK